MRKFLLVLGIFSLLTLSAQACTFSWPSVSTYTDNTPITEVVSYNLYFTPVGDTGVQKVAIVTTNSTTLTCLAGNYFVTAQTPLAQESVPSNVVSLKQTMSPVQLKWSN